MSIHDLSTIRYMYLYFVIYLIHDPNGLSHIFVHRLKERASKDTGSDSENADSDVADDAEMENLDAGQENSENMEDVDANEPVHARAPVDDMLEIGSDSQDGDYDPDSDDEKDFDPNILV